MARNGSGTYVLPAGQPVVTGTTISSTTHNTLASDLANALTTSIATDGQSVISANIPFSGFKATGLGAATVAGDALRFEQLFSQGTPVTLASAGTTDIGAQNSVAIEITGTTTITSFGTTYNGPRYLRFTGALILTHGASLNLPGAANITTAAGDTAMAYPNQAANGWNIVSFSRGAYAAPAAVPAASGANSDITALNALTTPLTSAQGGAQIQPIGATVASNALTISASAMSLDFRSAALSSGAVLRANGTPSNLVVPSTATLGTVSAVQSRLIVLALYINATTIELAVVNLAGGTDLTETGLISTTAISAAANSAIVVYSNTARTSVAYRVIGYVESTQATAGTWVTAPSTIQGVGGQALTAMSSLGYGQTLQILVGSRAYATTYYNTTGKPISIYVVGTATSSSIGFINGFVNGSVCVSQSSGFAAGWDASIQMIVPAGANYSVNNTTSSMTLTRWNEVR